MIVLLSTQGHAGLSGDAWATLVAAIIAAAVAIVVMVFQRRGEQRDRKDEQTRRRKAIGTAILFEIDRFYRLYISRVLKTLSSAQNRAIPDLESPGLTPFPVYATNCAQIGELESQLAEAIVDFYALAQQHAFRICRYRDKYDSANRQHALSLLPDVRSGAENLVPIAYIACAYLCVYTGIPFSSGKFNVAHGEGISPATREGARTAINRFQRRIGVSV